MFAQMEMSIIYIVIALLIGAGIVWLITSQSKNALQRERDDFAQRFRQAVVDLETADKEREDYRVELATLRTTMEAESRSHAAAIAALTEAKDALAGQFQEVASRLLKEAQGQFLESADARFRASEEQSGARLAQLLSPVNERLSAYETAVKKVEGEREAAFGNLKGLLEALHQSNESVKEEAARLSNSLRNAPKARGRWGEQQLRNVLESCGLSEYADFATEVSMTDGEGARLRPDVIIRVPGGQSLVIDAKVSLNAYQDAMGASDDGVRAAGLADHARSVKTHVQQLGSKAYWAQIENTPDYVILFLPGEHFLTAALEADPNLWDDAFERRVLLATPTNLIAIARTVAAVWRQEKLSKQAGEIAALGKELYARLSVMGGHIAKLGKNLDTAVSAYNGFVGSIESQVLTQARRFEALDIDTGNKSIDALPVVDTAVRRQNKLSPPDPLADA